MRSRPRLRLPGRVYNPNRAEREQRLYQIVRDRLSRKQIQYKSFAGLATASSAGWLSRTTFFMGTYSGTSRASNRFRLGPVQLLALRKRVPSFANAMQRVPRTRRLKCFERLAARKST